jgi:hypothetical protein
VKTWVCAGVWSVPDGEFEDLWSRADDESKRVNDPRRFEAEQQVARDGRGQSPD